MPRPKIDGAGRIQVPKDDRDEWCIEDGDTVNVRITTSAGKSRSVRDEIDSRGRIIIPIEQRDALNIGSGDRVEVTVLGVDGSGYECDECDETHDLGKTIIRDGGDRVVCVSCSEPKDRII